MTTPDEDPTVEEGKPNEESAAKKRKEPPHHDEEADFDTDTSPECDASSNFLEISRSEKKRDREKKRRCDVSRGLDQLMSLIFTIDPRLKAEAEDRHRNKIHKTKSEPEAVLNRVELINAAIVTLHRVHHESEERKLVIGYLAKGLLAASGGPGNDPVIPPLARAHDIMQQRLGLHQQINAAALASSVAGTGLRQPLRSGDACTLLQEYLCPSRRPAPTRLSGILGAHPPNNLSFEDMLGGIQNARTPLVSSCLKPDAMALLRALEQDRSRGDPAYNRSLLQRGPLDGEPGDTARNNQRSILGRSAVPAPVLPRSSDIGAPQTGTF